ncbi:probable serine/threonine-protein kinase clkA [Drosophila albomicans]|uniref:Probable serine/threonine-protein kinase clkA n=1 Tax=Drosophila albomicans TaxID=7291 RepID=A0A6P8X6S5_DROAB|nr:probable serine/threonine-protein kinase clkA [Drosophila albomicans]
MEAKEETYFQSCKNIMRTLLSKKYKNLNWIFKDPLEPTTLGLDDYKKIVKYPLDLGTISRRLHVKYYLNPFHFVTDVRRVFENTYLYTTPDHLCYVMAQKLETIFEDLVAKCDANDEGAESNVDSGDDEIIGDEYENKDVDNENKDESESKGEDDRNEQENISNGGDTSQYIIVNRNEDMNNALEDKRQHWKNYGYLSSAVDNGNEISQYGNRFETDNEYQNTNYEYENNADENRVEDYGNAFEMDNKESVKGEGVVAFKNYSQYWERNEYQNNNEYQYNAFNNVDMDNRYGNDFETDINERIEDKGAVEDMNCANENSSQNWVNNEYQYNNNQYVSNAVYNGEAYSQYGNNNGYQNIHYTYGIWMSYGNSQYWGKNEYVNNFYENVTTDNRYGNNFEGADEHLNNAYDNREDQNMNYEYENNADDNRVMDYQYRNAFGTDHKVWVKDKGAVAHENNSQYWDNNEYKNNNEYQYNAYDNVDTVNRYGNNYERTDYEGAEENLNEYGNNAYGNVDSGNRNGNERIEYERANQSPHTYEDSQYEYENVASDANDDDKDLEEPMTLEYDSYLQVSLLQLEGVMLHKVFHMIYQSEDLHFQHPIKKIKFDVRRLKVKTKRAIIEYIESQGMSGKRACRLMDLEIKN